MRAWFWTLVVFIGAVGAALLLQDHGGNLLILVQPWRIEISLTLAVILLVTAFVLIYAVLRLVAWLVGGPGRLRSWQGSRAQRRDLNLLENAWVNVLEGRLEPADRDLSRLLGKSRSQTSKVLAALVSAKGAHERGDSAGRDAALEQARLHAGDDARLREAVAVVSAELYLDARQARVALGLLQPIQDAGTRQFHATRLLLHAHQQLGDHDRVYELARLLRRRNAIDALQANRLIEEATAARLHAAGHAGFRGVWNDLKADEKSLPAIALAGAEIQAEQGDHEEAARILENAIARTMDLRLILAYGQCPAEQVRRRLNKAEAWLRDQGDNPVLLVTMGRLCMTGKLWGLAERYLLESMRLRSDVRIHALLGNLYDAQGRPVQAAHHWRLACQVAGRLSTPAEGRTAWVGQGSADPLLVPLSAETATPAEPEAPGLPADAPEKDVAVLPDDGKPPPSDAARTQSETELDGQDYFDTAPIPGVDVTQTSDRPRGAAGQS